MAPRTVLSILLACTVLGAGGVLVAQMESNDRVVAPIDSSTNYEVGGVLVDTAAKDAETARMLGWREAQRRGWKLLYARLHGVPPAAAPGLPDSTLDSIVAAIAVEDEQIGPTRYIARLSVLFDRARAGALLGVHGEVARSAPMLVVPIQYAGGALTSLELRNGWQEAWARFRPGGSPIDYVRPSGAGADPLLLNAGQTMRRGRSWWRLLLDQYGATDVVMPAVSIHRAWPGGPASVHVVLRHGPDNDLIDEFTLTGDSGDGMAKLLDAAVRESDARYGQALREGRLGADPSLAPPEVAEPAAVAETGTEETVDESGAPITGAAYTVQIDTPDAAAANAAEAALRAVPGASAITTQSLALGGVSIIRLVYQGDPAALRIALAARGWSASDAGGGTIRMRRATGGGEAPPAPSPPPAPPPAQ